MYCIARTCAIAHAMRVLAGVGNPTAAQLSIRDEEEEEELSAGHAPDRAGISGDNSTGTLGHGSATSSPVTATSPSPRLTAAAATPSNGGGPSGSSAAAAALPSLELVFDPAKPTVAADWTPRALSSASRYSVRSSPGTARADAATGRMMGALQAQSRCGRTDRRTDTHPKTLRVSSPNDV